MSANALAPPAIRKRSKMNERIKALKRQAEDYAGKYSVKHQVFGQALIDALDQKFAELIGHDMLKLANRHGNIKLHSINEYFGFEKEFGINTNNIKRFVDERTN